jgi:hypothetical protein
VAGTLIPVTTISRQEREFYQTNPPGITSQEVEIVGSLASLKKERNRGTIKLRACNKTLPDIRRWSLVWFDVIQAQQITCSNGVTSPKSRLERSRVAADAFACCWLTVEVI